MLCKRRPETQDIRADISWAALQVAKQIEFNPHGLSSAAKRQNDAGGSPSAAISTRDEEGNIFTDIDQETEFEIALEQGFNELEIDTMMKVRLTAKYCWS